MALTLAVGCAVAGATLRVDALVGHAGTFHLGAFTPVTVTVHNDGRDVTGQLEVMVDDGETSTARLTRVRAVDLPRGTRKRWQVTVPLRSITEPLMIRVRSGGKVLVEQPVSLRERFTDARLILALSRDAHLDYLNRLAPEDGNERTRVVYPLPEQLPTTWRGYDAVAAVVVQGVSLERLSVAQYRALRDWIASGGVLAVVGGPAWAEATTPRLASLLPAMPIGLQDAPAEEALAAAFGESLHAPKAFRINRLSRVNGRVLLRAPGQPLIVERDEGEGRVMMLAFDVTRYPFDTWSGLADLWWRVLGLPPGRGTALRVTDEREADTPVLTALAGAGGGFPDHLGVITFLALYLGVLVALHQARLGRSVRPGYGALTLIGLPAVFGGIGWWVFGPLLYPPVPAAVTATVLSPLPGTQRAVADVELGLYAPFAGQLRFTHAGAAPAFIAPDPANPEEPVPAWLSGDTGERFVGPESAQPYRIYRYRGSAVVPLGVDLTIERRGSVLEARVDNRSPTPLLGAWVALGDDVHELGRIAAGSSTSRVLDVALGDTSLDGLVSRFQQAGLRRGLARAGGALVQRRLAEEREAGAFIGTDARLVALTHGPVRATAGSRHWRHVDVAVVLSRAPVPEIAEGPDGDLAEDPR